MRKHHLIIAILLANLTAAAQQSLWIVKSPHEITTPLRRLPPVDRKGITSRLRMKSSDLRAELITTQSEDVFFVQDFGSDFCGAVGNCDFWILDNRYNLILEGKAQWASLLPTTHNDHHDVLTSLHDSAVRSERTQWRFDGARYRRFACAEVEYSPLAGNVYKHPRVSAIPCR